MTLTFDAEEDKIYRAAMTEPTNADEVKNLVAAHPLEAARLIVSLAPLAHRMALSSTTPRRFIPAHP